MPILAAHLSYLMSDVKGGTPASLTEANRLVRIAKAHAKEGIHFFQHVNPAIATWTDAAHASRKDLNSQGGYLVGLVDGDFMDDQESKVTILSWNSWKLQRVARSSSGAEVQAASEAQEESEYTRLVLAEIMYGRLEQIRDWAEHMTQIRSSLIMDCRGVFDALTRTESSGLGLRDKRAGLEALALRQSMERTRTVLRWCHSHAQLADMMTKYNTSTTATWEYFRHRGQHWRLIYGPDFVSAKNRAKKGLKILEDDPDSQTYELEGCLFRVLGPQDAWVCIIPELKKFEDTFNEEDPKEGCYHNVKYFVWET